MPGAEQLIVPFSQQEWQEWKVANSVRRPGQLTMQEFIPKAQTLDTWQQMLTVQVFHNLPLGLAQFMGQMKASFEDKQPCDHTSLRPLGSRMANGYEASLHLLTCTKEKQTGKGQFTLMLGIRGQDALYVVQRAWRGEPYAADATPLAEAEYKGWQAFMDAVQVCDPRAAEHPCPTNLTRVQ
jgi:hypothetical protein